MARSVCVLGYVLSTSGANGWVRTGLSVAPGSHRGNEGRCDQRRRGPLDLSRMSSLLVTDQNSTPVGVAPDDEGRDRYLTTG